MEKKALYSKCGFFCNCCPAYKDNSRTMADRERGSALWEKYFGLHFKADIVRCEGCQSPAPWKTGNLLPDRACPVRACATYNEVETCAHCSLFPCEEYLKRVPGAELRRQREKAANIAIPDDEYLKYIELYEGQLHLKQLHAALGPDEITPPKPFSADVDVVTFPASTNLTPDKQEEMRQLHSILEKIFSTKAVSYIDQVLLERKRPYLHMLIWVIGLYGRPENENLVLESAVCVDKKECSRLVRKKDNTLFEPFQEVINSLKQYGIQIEFKPSGKNWTLILGIEESAGGPAVLTALKTYVLKLIEKYGEPVYTGSCNLKGRGFKLFSKAEMSDL
ncbi:MAG: DUF3795 domain-containing protein [Dehalococcoidales bacterium]|nr:DUF3795 domain-containing protein [Dehalococcoidales bacterium]